MARQNTDKCSVLCYNLQKKTNILQTWNLSFHCNVNCEEKYEVHYQ